MSNATLADRLEVLIKRVRLDDSAHQHLKLSMFIGENSAAILAALRTAPAEAARGAVQPVECWAILDPDGNIDIDNVWRSDEMADWASELHRAERIRVRITPIAPPDAAKEPANG